MPLTDDFLSTWEHIIEEVNKTDVPLECIKKMVIKLRGKKQKTLNLDQFRRQGLDTETIESIVNKAFTELNDDIRDVEFVVDVHVVAQLIQPETDRLLNGL
jgi:hypothetical protein